MGLVGSYQFRFYPEQTGKDRREGPWSPQSVSGRKVSYDVGVCGECSVPLREWGTGASKDPVGLVQASLSPQSPFPLLFSVY